MWPYPWTHVGTPSHLGHMDRVAATMPCQEHAGAAQEEPDIGQWEGQDVSLVRPSSCNVKGGIPSSRRYLPTYLGVFWALVVSWYPPYPYLRVLDCSETLHRDKMSVVTNIRAFLEAGHMSLIYRRCRCHQCIPVNLSDVWTREEHLCIAVFFTFSASKALYWTLYHADL